MMAMTEEEKDAILAQRARPHIRLEWSTGWTPSLTWYCANRGRPPYAYGWGKSPSDAYRAWSAKMAATSVDYLEWLLNHHGKIE